MAMGKRFRQARLDQGLSQQELAQRVGVSQQTIQILERRDSERSRYAAQIAAALQVDLQWAVTGIGPREAAAEPVDLELLQHTIRILHQLAQRSAWQPDSQAFAQACTQFYTRCASGQSKPTAAAAARLLGVKRQP